RRECGASIFWYARVGGKIQPESYRSYFPCVLASPWHCRLYRQRGLWDGDRRGPAIQHLRGWLYLLLLRAIRRTGQYLSEGGCDSDPWPASWPGWLGCRAEGRFPHRVCLRNHRERRRNQRQHYLPGWFAERRYRDCVGQHRSSLHIRIFQPYISYLQWRLTS